MDVLTPTSQTDSIGRISRVPLREVWKHEALNLTTWLEKNIDVISDALGLHLSMIEREQAAGDFSVDLVAQEANGDLVVIENQLERSNHDHLGKVLTYLAMANAKRAVWIVAEPRPEHVKAIQWLNDSSEANFHLLKLEAIRIDESRPAPLFTVITGPSEALQEARKVRSEQKAAGNNYQRFWRYLLDEAVKQTPLHKNISPSQGNWISASPDIPSFCGLNYVLSRGRGRVELYIDSPARGKEFNEQFLRALEARKEAIESAFGAPLSWEDLPHARACRICFWVEGMADLNEDSTWPPFVERLVRAMIALDKALRPHLAAALKGAESAVKLMEQGRSDLGEMEEEGIRSDD